MKLGRTLITLKRTTKSGESDTGIRVDYTKYKNYRIFGLQLFRKAFRVVLERIETMRSRYEVGDRFFDLAHENHYQITRVESKGGTFIYTLKDEYIKDRFVPGVTEFELTDEYKINGGPTPIKTKPPNDILARFGVRK